MSKADFLAALAAELRDLSREDIARSLEYYSEMIDERMEEGLSAQEAVAALGSPEAIGQEILKALPRERNSSPENWGKQLKENIQKAMDISMEECKGAVEWANRFANKCADQVHVHVDQASEGFFDRFSGRPRETHEYPITEAFEAVDIQLGISDLRILRSAGEEALVVSQRSGDIPETVEVREGVLTVLQPLKGDKSGVKGSIFGFSFGFGSSGGLVTVYLPDRLWKSLRATSLSGDIEVMDIRCEEARLQSTSGDIDARHISVAGELVMESKSGDISARDFKAAQAHLGSMSGDIEALSGEGDNLSASSRSGDISLENVLVTGQLNAESASGDVELRRSDAGQMELKSSSGDIQATLLSLKDFTVHSSVGDVRVPESVAGAGECRARSSSGDIDIRLAP